MRKKLILGLGVVAFLFSACQSKSIQPDSIPVVKLSTVKQYRAGTVVSFPGKVKAASEVNLAFRISGPISAIHVKEGEYVRAGQTLAEMDSRDYALQFSATEAEYHQIRAEVERVIQLYEKQSVPENDYDKATAGLKQITAKYNAHKNALNDTKLIAPFDGYIQKRYFDKNETVAAGMPIFTIISADMPEVEINIPANEFIRRDKFENFTCTFDIFPHHFFPLTLISVNQKANINQLYTVRLKMTGNSSEKPTPGMTTMVNIHLRPEADSLMTIPVNAVFEQNGKTSVWVYEEATTTIHARAVHVHEILTDGTLVISTGLEAGEKVVAAGVHRLSEGEKVKLWAEASETNVGGLL